MAVFDFNFVADLRREAYRLCQLRYPTASGWQRNAVPSLDSRPTAPTWHGIAEASLLHSR